MNVQRYRKRLLEIEKHLAVRQNAPAPEPDIESSGDSGDRSVVDVAKSDHFSEAELDSMILQQVRDALQRIDDGTYGKCVVDGAPITEKRLDAVPWTPYCLKHQNMIEAASQPRTFTL
jgi:DnaK suppressor protein